MLDTDIRAPLDEKLYAYIPALVALARLGDPQALSELVLLRQSKDVRIRAKCSKNIARCWVAPTDKLVERKLAGQHADDYLLENVRQDLRDPNGQAREVGIKTALYHPDNRWYSDLAPHLADPDKDNRRLASDALIACATTDDQALYAVFPYLEYNDPKDEKAYEVRIDALRALRFPHNSTQVQAQLLKIFDRPELGVKRELTAALRYCPDQAGLRQTMLDRLATDQTVPALFVLATLHDPNLRPTLHQHLHGPTSRHALAALLGLFPILDHQDRSALEACREYWSP